MCAKAPRLEGAELFGGSARRPEYKEELGREEGWLLNRKCKGPEVGTKASRKPTGGSRGVWWWDMRQSQSSKAGMITLALTVSETGAEEGCNLTFSLTGLPWLLG